MAIRAPDGANNSERPVDALALILEKGESLTHSLTYNLKSRDASASKKGWSTVKKVVPHLKRLPHILPSYYKHTWLRHLQYVKVQV